MTKVDFGALARTLENARPQQLHGHKNKKQRRTDNAPRAALRTLRVGDLVCTLHCNDGSTHQILSPAAGGLLETNGAVCDDVELVNERAEREGYLALVLEARARDDNSGAARPTNVSAQNDDTYTNDNDADNDNDDDLNDNDDNANDNDDDNDDDNE